MKKNDMTNTSHISRADFLKKSLAASALFAFNPLSSRASTPTNCPQALPTPENFYADTSVKKSDSSLRILVLGGTKFFGPPMVQYAIERGHQVTLLNRGVTNPGVFKKAKHVKTDRINASNAYDLVSSQVWDVVIDTWQGNPLVVKEAVEALKGSTKLYLYISSIAVYGREHYSKPVIHEGDTYLCKDVMPTDKAVEMKDYRSRKQLADEAIRLAMPDSFTTLRCHGIHGFYEEFPSPGNRYWPVRMTRGGHVICPGDGEDHIQFVHVQDAARFAIHCAEQRHKGVFHLGKRYTFQEYLHACKAFSTADVTLHWFAQEKLTQHGIRPFSDMSAYVPRSSGPGFNNCNDARAIACGLQYRSLADTLRDDVAGFVQHYPSDFEFGNPDCGASGLSIKKELEVLQQEGLF